MMYKVIRVIARDLLPPKTAASYRYYWRALLFVLAVRVLNYFRLPRWASRLIRYKIERLGR